MQDEKKTFWHLLAISLFISCCIIFLRKPDAFLNPQFWAEDGKTFFAQMYNYGPSSIFKLSSGYHNLYPRIIASLADLLKVPLEILPAFYNYGWLLAFFITFAYIWFRLDLSANEKFLFSITLTLIPISTAGFVSLTNSQWLLALTLVLIPVAKHPKNTTQYIIDYMLIFIAGLSSLCCLLFIPLFLFNALKTRNKHNYCLFFILLIVSIIQAASFSGSARMQHIGGGLNFLNPYLVDVLCKQYLYLFFGSYFINAPHFFKLSYLAFIAVIMTVMFIDFIKKDNRIGIFTLTSGLAVLIATLILFRRNLVALYPLVNGIRYFYIPGVTFIWSLIIFANPITADKLKKYIIVFLLFISVYYLNFRNTPQFVDYHWPQWAKQIQRGREIIIPINPPGWQLHIDGNKRNDI